MIRFCLADAVIQIKIEMITILVDFCLDFLQSLVQEASSSDGLQRAMSALQEEEEGVCPGLAWVQASVLSLLGAHHALLQSSSQILLEAGVESPGDGGGEGGLEGG